MFVDFFYILERIGRSRFPHIVPSPAEGPVNVGLSRVWMTFIPPLGPFWSKANAILTSTTGCLLISFTGAELPDFRGIDLDAAARELLDEWLKDPEALAQALGISQETVAGHVPGRADQSIFWIGSRNRTKPITAAADG